jgi:methionyl-tRNA formyltransferase
LVTSTGLGLLELTELQAPGGKRLPAAEYLQGHPLNVGDVMG